MNEIGFNHNMNNPKEVEDTKKYRLTRQHHAFLEQYALTKDVNMALAAANIKTRNKEPILSHPFVQEEMDAIHQSWRTKHKMTAERASIELIEMFEQFKQDYKNTIGTKEQPGMASAAAKVLDSYLKATGLDGKSNSGGGGGNIVINIDIGATDKKDHKARLEQNIIDVTPYGEE